MQIAYIWHLDNPEKTVAKIATVTVRCFSASFFHQSECLNAVSMPYNNNIIPFSFFQFFFSFSSNNLIHVYVHVGYFNLMTIKYCLQDQHKGFGPLWRGSRQNHDCFPVERISNRGQSMHSHNFFHFHLLPETPIPSFLDSKKSDYFCWCQI